MNKVAKDKDKLLIGRREAVDLPELKLHELDAKIDTGAYTSSLHCHHIEVIRKAGRKLLRFKLLDPEHPNYQRRIFVFRNFDQKKVKSSNGESEMRFKIKTKLEIYGKSFKTEFTLTDRRDMKYPILLGRKFIKQNFVVDVSKHNLASKSKTYRAKIIKEEK